MRTKSKNKELLDYMDYIHRLAENNIKDEYTNSGPDRAAIVFSELFSNSSKEFRLYAGSLGGEISSNVLYISGIRQFLQKKNSILKILIENINELPLNSELYTILKNNSSKVELKKSNVSALNRDGSEIHFSVGDEKMYRIEVDPKNFKAVGSFNNPKEAIQLKNLFEDIFQSTEYSSDTSLLTKN